MTILKNRIENFWIYFHPIKIATFQIESNHKIKFFISNSEKVVDFPTHESTKLAAAQNCQIILTPLSFGSHQNKNIIPKIVDNDQNYYRYELEEQKKDQKVIYEILCRGKNIKLI
ncbi:MAG: hypothetical protein ACKPIC_19615, partial [Microcystis panniformis]